MSSPGRPCINILLTGITVLLFLFFCEAGYRVYEIIRISSIPAPERDTVVWCRYDEEVGWKHIPGVSGKGVVTDCHGYRIGNENEIDRPLPEKVIAALGDSFTFGDGVDGYEAWPYLLGRMIDQPDVGVANLGVCAYGIDQMYLLYQEEKDIIRPRVVIAAIISWDMMRMIKSRWQPGGRQKPRFVWRDGELECTNVPVPLKLDDDRRRVRWYTILFALNRSYLLERLFPPEKLLETPEIPPHVYQEKNIVINKYAESVLLAQRLIERWRKEVEDEGRRFILVLIPLKERIQYYHSYLITLRDNLSLQGVEIVDCQKAFQQAAGEGKKLFRGSHPSPEGQKVIAGQVYYYLVSTGAI